MRQDCDILSHERETGVREREREREKDMKK